MPEALSKHEVVALLAAVEFFLSSHDGRHEAESGATHSGYAKLQALLDVGAFARDRTGAHKHA